MSGSMRASFSSLPTASPTMSHRARHLAVPLRENGLRRLRQVHQRLGIAQASAFGLQLLLLAGAQVGGDNLVDLEAEQVDALGHGARVLAQPLQFAAHLAQVGHLLRHLAAQRQQPGVAVEQRCVLALEQVEVFALAVHVDQQVGQFASVCSLTLRPLTRQMLRPLSRTSRLNTIQPGLSGSSRPCSSSRWCTWSASSGSCGSRKEASISATSRRRAPIRRGALAQQQADGVDDDRLACARFAGQYVEAGAKGQVKLVDDGEIADAQFIEHRRQTSGRQRS